MTLLQISIPMVPWWKQCACGCVGVCVCTTSGWINELALNRSLPSTFSAAWKQITDLSFLQRSDGLHQTTDMLKASTLLTLLCIPHPCAVIIMCLCASVHNWTFWTLEPICHNWILSSHIKMIISKQTVFNRLRASAALSIWRMLCDSFP